MIRMGRNSRPDESTSNSYQPQTSAPEPLYQYQTENTPTASRPVTDSESMARDIKEGRLSGFVGHGTVLTGETNFQAMLRVDGHLMGTIASDSGTLIVGTQGQVDANVSVASAQINGTVNGDIIASERIQLGRTAKVVGNIMTPRLVIEEGAVLEGGCTMLKAREAHEKRETEARSQYATASTSAYQKEEPAEIDEDDEFLGTAAEEEEEAAETAAL